MEVACLLRRRHFWAAHHSWPGYVDIEPRERDYYDDAVTGAE